MFDNLPGKIKQSFFFDMKFEPGTEKTFQLFYKKK